MKKHLIASAIVAAFAAPAMAQNVSVYGIIDAGIQSQDNGGDRVVRGVNGALATSRLGFRGTEDLGGGLKASFNLEAQLLPNDGFMGNGTAAASDTALTTASAAAVASTQSFSREAWVGLSGGFGELRIGQQDVTYAQDIDSGVSFAGNLGLSAQIAKSGDLGDNASNVIKYISPTVGGLTAQVGYSSGHASGITTDLEVSQKGLSVAYAVGPAKLFAGYHVLSVATAGAANTKQTRLGGSYDFGPVAVGAFYNKTKDQATLANSAGATQTGDVTVTQINAKAPLGNGLAVHGVYASAKAEGIGQSNVKGTGFVVALTKELSKRTTVYGAYTGINNSTNGTMTMTGVSAPAAAGDDQNAVTVGITHSF